MPIASIPAECIRRLFVGGNPQADGKTSRTAFQKVTRVRYMAFRSKDSSPAALNGDSAPSGLFILFRIILMMAVSVITALLFSTSERRLISPRNGDLGSRFRSPQISLGTFLEASSRGRS